jgi:hypothetical protein
MNQRQHSDRLVEPGKLGSAAGQETAGVYSPIVGVAADGYPPGF